VNTTPVRSTPRSVSSSGANAVVSLVLPSTCTWPSTTRACWSITASRCRPGTVTPSALVCREPRMVLPSTASTRRRPAGAVAAHRPWTNAPITVSNRSASTWPSSLRMVDSDGHRSATPSAAATSTGRSATHSAAATNERAPAATALVRTLSSGPTGPVLAGPTRFEAGGCDGRSRPHRGPVGSSFVLKRRCRQVDSIRCPAVIPRGAHRAADPRRVSGRRGREHRMPVVYGRGDGRPSRGRGERAERLGNGGEDLLGEPHRLVHRGDGPDRRDVDVPVE